MIRTSINDCNIRVRETANGPRDEVQNGLNVVFGYIVLIYRTDCDGRRCVFLPNKPIFRFANVQKNPSVFDSMKRSNLSRKRFLFFVQNLLFSFPIRNPETCFGRFVFLSVFENREFPQRLKIQIFLVLRNAHRSVCDRIIRELRLRKRHFDLNQFVFGKDFSGKKRDARRRGRRSIENSAENQRTEDGEKNHSSHNHVTRRESLKQAFRRRISNRRISSVRTFRSRISSRISSSRTFRSRIFCVRTFRNRTIRSIFAISSDFRHNFHSQ